MKRWPAGVPVVTTLEAGSVVRDGMTDALCRRGTPSAGERDAEIVEDRQKTRADVTRRARPGTRLYVGPVRRTLLAALRQELKAIIEAGERNGGFRLDNDAFNFPFGLYTVRLAIPLHGHA